MRIEGPDAWIELRRRDDDAFDVRVQVDGFTGRARRSEFGFPMDPTDLPRLVADVCVLSA